MFQQHISLDKFKGDVRIVFIGDLHIGLKGFRADIFDKMLEELKEPNTYWIGLGDMVESRTPKAKLYNDDDTEMNVQEQFDYFFDHIRPYMKQCLGIHIGNHEMAISQDTTMNPLRTFSADNKVPYLGGVALTVFERNGKQYRLCTSHGHGGGEKVGGSINKIVDYLSHFDADAICVGHYHKLAEVISEKPILDEFGRYGWKPTRVILNGSCLESYGKDHTSYSEAMLMPPTALGYAILWLDKDLNADVSLVPVR